MTPNSRLTRPTDRPGGRRGASATSTSSQASNFELCSQNIISGSSTGAKSGRNSQGEPFREGGLMPQQLRLEASSFCQLRCPSCPTTSRAIHPTIGSGFLRFENFRQLIDENPSLKRVELSNYGEILLNPHLLKILEYANAKAVAITISTGVNLNHATDELLEGLVKYRVRHMGVSIDGASSDTYRIYRIRGNFDKVIHHIEQINHFKREHRSEFPQLLWQFVVFGHNEHEIPMAREMAARLGMDFYTKISWDAKFS